MLITQASCPRSRDKVEATEASRKLLAPRLSKAADFPSAGTAQTDTDCRLCNLQTPNNWLSASYTDKMVYSFTAEELSKYDGVQDKKIYFSVRGTVYDVSKAPDFYGPGVLPLATAEHA